MRTKTRQVDCCKQTEEDVMVMVVNDTIICDGDNDLTGDGDNDKEMLQVAGLGIAMKNASHSTKKCADYVSPLTNNEDALAHFLHQYVLKRKF